MPDPYASKIAGREKWDDERRAECDFLVCGSFEEKEYEWQSALTASKVAVMCLSKNISIVYADIFKYPPIRELSASVANSEAFENPQSENEFSSYNYNRIQSVISGNVEENVNQVTKEEIGDIMITGATGFLGIHVLKAYLDNYDGKVYCLVRKGKYESMEKRMMHMLMYYFDNPCQELFGERIICMDGDITSKEQVEKFADYKFNTIINCAACVKHFAAGDVLEKINVHGVENLIEFCKNSGFCKRQTYALYAGAA